MIRCLSGSTNGEECGKGQLGYKVSTNIYDNCFSYQVRRKTVLKQWNSPRIISYSLMIYQEKQQEPDP